MRLQDIPLELIENARERRRRRQLEALHRALAWLALAAGALAAVAAWRLYP